MPSTVGALRLQTDSYGEPSASRAITFSPPIPCQAGRLMTIIARMQKLKTANLALKFLLELTAFAAFAFWGATVGTGVTSVLVALAATGAAIVLWASFAAPRSTRRLPTAMRVPFELSIFGLAAAALAAAVSPAASLVFALAVLVNAVLLTVFRQWET